MSRSPDPIQFLNKMQSKENQQEADEKFLEKVKISQILPSEKKSVVVIKGEDTLENCLKIMVQNNLYSLPVTSNDQVIGLVDLKAIVRFILDLFYERANIAKAATDKVDLVQKNKFTPEDVAQVTSKFNSKIVKELINTPKIERTENDELKTLIKDLSVHERVPIVDASHKIVAVASQAMIVAFLVKNLDKLGPRAFESIEELNIINSPVHTVLDETPVIVSYAKMLESNFSALGIADEDQLMLGVISFKDIRGAFGDFSKLFMGTEDYINEIRQMDFRDMIPTVNIKSTASLAKAIAKLDACRIHRLFVYKEGDKPHHFSGILSLNNVLSVFIR